MKPFQLRLHKAELAGRYIGENLGRKDGDKEPRPPYKGRSGLTIALNRAWLTGYREAMREKKYKSKPRRTP